MCRDVHPSCRNLQNSDRRESKHHHLGRRRVGGEIYHANISFGRAGFAVNQAIGQEYMLNIEPILLFEPTGGTAGVHGKPLLGIGGTENVRALCDKSGGVVDSLPTLVAAKTRHLCRLTEPINVAKRLDENSHSTAFCAGT
jgi:hypothetical protein